MVLTNDNLEKGSTIKFDMASNGKNWVIYPAIGLSGKILKVKTPFAIPSAMDKTNKKPMAKAERLTKIPRNKHKEKNPVSFTKKARTYSKSEKMMLTSV